MLVHSHHEPISIAPLLKRFLDPSAHPPSADDIASALSLAFTNAISPTQCASLLTLLETSRRSKDAEVIAKCAVRMRDAAAPVDIKAMREVMKKQGRQHGQYHGGLCDIVGTGGDGHSTFNVSTTASIIAASSLLVSKHGAKASSSKSGSADLLQAIQPRRPVIEALTAERLPRIFEEGSYAFLFASTFHPGMKHVAPIRKELGFRTIFNILGPLANPMYSLIEASVIGVARQELGPVFAKALVMNGAKKAMVVCGAEDLDEISCAGKTNCWRLVQAPNPDFRGPKTEQDENYTTSDEEAPPRNLTRVEEFQLEPADFGLPSHPLSEVLPGKGPEDNAAVLMKMLNNELPEDDPTLHFVLMNAAALFVMSGICEADSEGIVKETGPGGGRWKEGVRRAREALKNGGALKALNGYIEFTNDP